MCRSGDPRAIGFVTGLGDRALGSAPLRGLPVEQQTMPALLERQAGVYGDAPLLRIGELEASYAGTCELAAHAAGTLARARVGRGDRVALMCQNRPELLELVLGCAWIGAIAVPINTAIRGPQLRHLLVNSGARVLAIDSTLANVLTHVEPPDDLEEVWALDGVPYEIPADYRVVAPPPRGDAIAAAPVGPGETLAILYTSGTTGPSKGVCCPHAQFYWWGMHVSDWLGIREGDVLYTCLPLFHTNALNAFAQALVSGARYVVGPRFSASRFWWHAGEAGADITYLLGAMVNMLYAQPASDIDRAHTVRVALAPATPPGLIEPFADRFGVELVEGYGSTETNAVIGQRAGEQELGTMGRIIEGFEALVVDENDAPVADGTPGELIVRHRAPFAFATGYWRMPEKTVEAWRNLWFHSGDRVVRDDQGRFRFVDRLKDVIRRRGENISSFEVEQVLIEHPAVAAVAVYPVPSEMAEDEVMAAVVPEEGAELDPVDLISHCEPRLAYFSIPRYLDIVDELPLTENGKVRKAVLRDRGVTNTAWDRETAGYKLTRK
jgi:carnitine-CoA ligase